MTIIIRTRGAEAGQSSEQPSHKPEPAAVPEPAERIDEPMNYTVEVTSLKERVAALTERVAALENALAALDKATVLDNAAELDEPVRFDSVERDAQGNVIIPADLPSYEDRQRAEAARRIAEVAAADAKSREGLPAGQWRDPCGLVRNHEGAYVSAVRDERDAQVRREIEKERAAQHHREVTAQNIFRNIGRERSSRLGRDSEPPAADDDQA